MSQDVAATRTILDEAVDLWRAFGCATPMCVGPAASIARYDGELGIAVHCPCGSESEWNPLTDEEVETLLDRLLHEVAGGCDECGHRFDTRKNGSKGES